MRGLFFCPDAVLCVPHGWALPPFLAPSQNIGSSFLASLWELGSEETRGSREGRFIRKYPFCRSKAQGGTTCFVQSSHQVRTGAVLSSGSLPIWWQCAVARRGSAARLPPVFPLLLEIEYRFGMQSKHITESRIVPWDST